MPCCFEAFVAAPWLWARVNPVLVYNVLLLGGIVSSGLGMFVLARYLIGDADAALVSAVVFTLVPYRVEHFMHLELQWTVWMPLTLWAIHRAYNEASLRFGALAGVLLWLQMLSSVYYGAFLVVIAGTLALLLAAAEPRRARAAVRPLGLGAVVVTVLTLPYAIPYIYSTRALGPRDPGEVANFSARLGSYLSAPQQNWLWGWTSFAYTGNELHLFPGPRRDRARGHRADQGSATPHAHLSRDPRGRGRAVARPERAGLCLVVRPRPPAAGVPRAGALRDPRLLRARGSRRVRVPVAAADRQTQGRRITRCSPLSWW